ncbi:sugar isomerase domain-containing protein [Horticoccus luteus]|uniref:Sugar isomerase domain-containing protein n=1 Tax=Horticoccus luteus TaxID=2862869 RepID=A0A8F9TVM0_9BACT|nr:sugar isomerase domain-containing protein [Horticoccus luteus]QYM79123.1 sugar isomerase domain-containing protein [Horticoccus luteus]
MTLSPLSDAYFSRANDLLARAWSANAPTLTALAPLLGASIARGGVIHTFGSGHSELISREIIGRAGGLVCVTGIIDPTGGFIENLPGYGTKLIERYDRQYQLLPGEIVLVISNSGKNTSPIDVALYAKKKGLTVVALTCRAMSEITPSQHPGGQRLFEVADYTLDNGGVPGDAIVDTGEGVMAGPTSTFIGASVLNWLMLATIDWLKTHGHPLPLLRSQNLPGAIEHNRALGQTYKGRLSRQLA